MAFIRVAPNEINLTELIRETYPNDTSVLKCSVITPDHKQSTQADEERADVFSKYDGWAFYDEHNKSNPPIDYRKFQKLASQMLLSVDHSSDSAPEESKTPKHIFDLKSRNKYNITTRHLTRTGWDITRNCETSQGPIWIKTKSTTLGQRTV